MAIKYKRMNGVSSVNLISATTAPLNIMVRKNYYDLEATLSLAKKILKVSVVDGFELQYLAEWDASTFPRDDKTKDHRRESWKRSEKHSAPEIAEAILNSSVPMISIHANRDAGICLCSSDRREQKVGRRIVHDSLSVADEVGSEIAVFHLWDTWKETFNPEFLADALKSISINFPSVIPTVENVPTHHKEYTPFELVERFDYVTLDLRWAAMYNEFDKYGAIRNKIKNVHIRGRLKDKRWVMDDSSFTIDHAVRRICNDWGYEGPLTLEPEGGLRGTSIEDFSAAMDQLAAIPA